MQLSRWPLWLQLGCALTLASIVVAAAGGYFVRVTETNYLRDELRRESLAAAQGLSIGLSSVRSQDGAYDLQKLLSDIRYRDTRIFSLALVDEDGRSITRWVSTSRGALDDVIYFRVPAKIPGREGTQLVVSWNVAAQHDRIEEHVDHMLGNVFVAIAVLGGLLVVLVHLLVVRPVGTLREGLERLALVERRSGFVFRILPPRNLCDWQKVSTSWGTINISCAMSRIPWLMHASARSAAKRPRGDSSLL